jgi:glycosyltransferase involved in cell wall biosynthesis
MSRTVFILVPSPHPTGPVKGAYAMANALVFSRRVVMVYLKDGPGVDANLDERVEVISLSEIRSGWRNRLQAYRKLLLEAGGRAKVGSISMCLSADLLNRFCADQAVICASVRGNLMRNYRHDYGMCGTLFAVAHLLALRSFDHVVAMTGAMSKQVWSVTGIRSKIIGNFVDEDALERFRGTIPNCKAILHFVYVGSLTNRKQPTLLVQAIESLINQGHHVKLDMIGDGPLRNIISSMLLINGLKEHIQLHGHLASPYRLIADADAFILPSCSEGISRAALEALYLGVPCVLRDVDGNAELLSEPNAGGLFIDDLDLPRAMFEAASLGHTRSLKSSLLPPSFRQSSAAMQYLELIEGSV